MNLANGFRALVALIAAVGRQERTEIAKHNQQGGGTRSRKVRGYRKLSSLTAACSCGSTFHRRWGIMDFIEAHCTEGHVPKDRNGRPFPYYWRKKAA